MLGISIDDDPDAPVGTPATRRTVAIHWHWTTEYTNAEIASALGVQEQTVDKYLDEGPTDGVRQQMDDVESEVRMVAVAELKDQLQRAGHQSRTAETPVKVWTDKDGNLRVEDARDEDGELTGKYAVPADMEMGPDEATRFYRRQEVRSIIQQLTELTGAGEPEQHEVTGAGGGPIQVEISNTVVSTEDDGSD